MLENQDIICFGPTDWWSMNPSCTTHIMRRLAGRNKILYVNPFSSDLAGGPKMKKGLGVRIARKIKSLAKYIRRPADNLYVFSPVFLPVQGRWGIDAFNNALLKLQIKAVCRLTGLSNPILWVENIRAADVINDFGGCGLKLYYVSDLFSDDSYTTGRYSQHKREKSVSDTSDLIICVSRKLYELKSSEKDCAFYVPHGVDFDLFRQAAEKRERLEELAGIPRPVAGYFGTLTAYNDIELLLWCARNLPDVSFVLAGQITGGDYSELQRLDNVHFLGRWPYEKIPQLCASFDVCMLAWKMSRWIESCNPLKMFEYMASGKPIVSVAIKEAMLYADVISIAHDKEEFCRAIRWELRNDTAERRRRRIEIAGNHNWDNQIEKISGLIIQAMAAKQEGEKENLHCVYLGTSAGG